MPEPTSFEQRIPEIEKAIESRRAKWRLTSMSYDDVSQIILQRVFLKYHTFDPIKGEFSHWLSSVIKRTTTNIMRDNYTTYSRPCIQKCVFNTGNGTCSKTSTGLQSDECPAYKRWRARKESQHNIAQTLPLENHIREVDSQPSDFVDIDGSKTVIDEKMKNKLTKHEYRIYTLLYIKGKSEEEVGIILKYKKKENSRTHAGYQVILQAKKLILEKAKEIISEENLV